MTRICVILMIYILLDSRAFFSTIIIRQRPLSKLETTLWRKYIYKWILLLYKYLFFHIFHILDITDNIEILLMITRKKVQLYKLILFVDMLYSDVRMGNLCRVK